MNWHAIRLALAIPVAGVAAVAEAVIHILVPETRRP